jgi:hypothetical protein
MPDVPLDPPAQQGENRRYSNSPLPFEQGLLTNVVVPPKIPSQ